MSDIRNLDTFTADILSPDSQYILVENHYCQPGVGYVPDRGGGFMHPPERFGSGISNEDFHSAIEDVTTRYGMNIVVQDTDFVLIKGDENVMGVLKEECGPRFSYDIAGTDAVKPTIDFKREARADRMAMDTVLDDDMHEAPHLDS